MLQFRLTMRLTNCPRLPLPFLQLQICGVYLRSQIPKSECLPAIHFSYPRDTITSTLEPTAASQARNPTSPPQLRVFFTQFGNLMQALECIVDVKKGRIYFICYQKN